MKRGGKIMLRFLCLLFQFHVIPTSLGRWSWCIIWWVQSLCTHLPMCGWNMYPHGHRGRGRGRGPGIGTGITWTSSGTSSVMSIPNPRVSVILPEIIVYPSMILVVFTPDFYELACKLKRCIAWISNPHTKQILHPSLARAFPFLFEIPFRI